MNDFLLNFRICIHVYIYWKEKIHGNAVDY